MARDGADFAVWSHYKWLNAGPGAVGGFGQQRQHAVAAQLAADGDAAQAGEAGALGHQSVDALPIAADGLLHPFGRVVVDADAADHRADLVAKLAEELQRVALLIGDARNQPGDQDLAGDHPAVEFFHSVPLQSWQVARSSGSPCRGGDRTGGAL